LRGIREERIRHARELSEVREETRKKERDAAEPERKRCNILERKIAKAKEIVAARESPRCARQGNPGNLGVDLGA
jgi:hypothetical protein